MQKKQGAKKGQRMAQKKLSTYTATHHRAHK